MGELELLIDCLVIYMYIYLLLNCCCTNGTVIYMYNRIPCDYMYYMHALSMLYCQQYYMHVGSRITQCQRVVGYTTCCNE